MQYKTDLYAIKTINVSVETIRGLLNIRNDTVRGK